MMMMMILCPVPGKVLNVRVTRIDTNTLNIAWDPRDDVTLYEVRHWRLHDVKRIHVNVTSSSNLTLLRLVEDTQYSFQVEFTVLPPADYFTFTVKCKITVNKQNNCTYCYSCALSCSIN